jgi:superfamily II DNA or RNA helicase
LVLLHGVHAVGCQRAGVVSAFNANTRWALQMSLRPYQLDCIAAIRDGLTKGVNRQLVVMSTGLGKTVVFANLPAALNDVLPGRMLVLAHRDELLAQAIEKIKHWNPTLRVEKEAAEHYASPDADVVVASVATLGRKGTQRGARLGDFTKVIVDEAHHAASQSYGNIFESAGLLAPDSKRLLCGFSATPNRGDGKALAAIFDKITFNYGLRGAIESGWLCDIRGVRIRTRTNLDNVKTVAGDFAQAELSDEVNTPERNQMIVKGWQEVAADRQTVVFTVTIAHAQDMAAVFVRNGIKAEAVWGDDPNRAEKLRKFNASEIQVLLNAQLLTEGWDSWVVSCIVLAKPTKSASAFTQMVGRGTRLEDGTGNLKDAQRAGKALRKIDCIIIDVSDCTKRHSLVTLPSLLGMNAQLDLKGKSLVGAAVALEHAQDEHPHIDFSKLEDIDGIAPLVESINLWDIKYPTEVTANSELSWHATMDGAFALLMPAGDSCYIRQNAFERWETTATIGGRRYRGERDTLEEMFRVADALVCDVGSEHLKILRQVGKEKWHGQPASEAQKKLLLRFYKGRQIPPTLTSGTASKLIGDFKAKQTARA